MRAGSGAGAVVLPESRAELRLLAADAEWCGLAELVGLARAETERLDTREQAQAAQIAQLQATVVVLQLAEAERQMSAAEFGAAVVALSNALALDGANGEVRAALERANWAVLSAWTAHHADLTLAEGRTLAKKTGGGFLGGGGAERRLRGAADGGGATLRGVRDGQEGDDWYARRGGAGGRRGRGRGDDARLVP